MLLLLLLVAGVTNTLAQNVTISPKSGSLVSGNMDGHDTGYALLLSSLWRHEQLSLSMTASDRDGLTEGGEISKPGSVLGIRDFGTADKPNKMLTIIGGNRPSFLVVSLPKGYRITGYRLTLINNLVGANVVPSPLPQGAQTPDSHYRNLNNNTNHLNSDVNIMRFYETKPWKTDGTNSGCTGRQNEEGYDETQVRYLALGSDWANGQIGTTAEEILAQAKNGNDGDINPGDAGKEFYMERFGDDMGNQLYFRLVKNYSHYGISIKSFEILFTAEGTFEADVTPEVVGHAQHVAKSPFLTSKMEIGEMTLNTDPNTGAQRYTYNENNVKDMVAYTYLYQQGAVKKGVPSEDVTIPARITPVRVDGRDLYALRNDTFFIETPIEVETQSGWPAPVGYRIVGATFNYLWGSDTDGGEISLPNAVQIRSGNRYLRTTDLKFHSNSENSVWQVDDHGNIYTGADNNRRYLSCYGDDENVRTITTSTSATGAAAKWNLHFDETDENHYVFYEDSHGSRYYLRRENSSSNTVQVVKDLDKKNRATYSQNGTGTHVVQLPAFHPGAYTLKVYDKEGNYEEDSDGNPTKGLKAVVDSESAAGGSLKLDSLNNDAVKFEITGLTPYTKNGETINPQALVSVTLQMQALDPYIDKMDIVCTDKNEVLELKQTFTANDFSVSGGKFIFYVPEDYSGQELTFTFKDLYSKYGDNTYYDGTGTGYGRYSYVTSPYFLDKIDGNGNDGLYDVAYDKNAKYNNKVFTSTAGNIRFKFNNAEDLGESSSQRFLIETPFSVAEYLKTTDPDFDPEEDPTGEAEPAKFIPCKLKAVADADQNSDIYYVFTADETRYNIAPGSTDKAVDPETGEETEETVKTPHAWQHRAYAFYRMDIELRAKTFTPVITPTPVYEKTLYTKDGSDSEDSMWGVSLKTTDPDDGEEVEGYLSVQEILDNIKGREAILWQEGEELPAGVNVGDVKKEKITGILDENGVNGPKSMKEILYIDGTNLKSILNSAKKEGETTKVLDLQTLRNEMAVNSLIFLPENTTSTLDNVAYKTSGVTYHAGRHIVMTDKQPFYSPYDIQVDPANYATYTRQITSDANGKVTYATVILPFTLKVASGIHTNETGIPGAGEKFSVNEMKDSLEMKLQSSVDYGTAYFDKIGGSNTEANKPYMVHVEGETAGDTISFVASQKGALVVATTDALVDPVVKVDGVDTQAFTGKYFKGAAATASVTFKDKTSGSYTLTAQASYSGGKYDRAVSENVFYFAHDKYLDLHTLAKSAGQYLLGYPFRGVYTYPGTSYAKQMKGFFVSFDELENGTTGIDQAVAEIDLVIRAGKGTLSLTATRAQDVNIHAVNGVNMKRVELEAGESQVVSLPAGIYIVNGTKIVVK